MRRLALALLVAAAIAGCSSTVLLGTLGDGGGIVVDGGTDLARPRVDAFDGGGDLADFGGPGDGFDGGSFDGGIFDFGGSDGAALVDLAQ